MRKRKSKGLSFWPISLRKAFGISFMIHMLLLGGVGSCGGAGNGHGSQGSKTGDKVDFDAVDKSKDKANPSEAIQVQFDHREIVDKPKEANESSSLPKDKDGTQRASAISRDCPGGKWFGGIGVQITYYKSEGLFNVYGGVVGKIFKVYPGYPASRSGIQVGDVVLVSESLEHYEDKIIGEPGTTVNLMVIRPSESMEPFNVSIVREKICFKEEKKSEGP